MVSSLHLASIALKYIETEEFKMNKTPRKPKNDLFPANRSPIEDADCKNDVNYIF
jgi:hypothetical protein